VRTCEWGDGVQCPNDRNPIFFTYTSFLSNRQLASWASSPAYAGTRTAIARGSLSKRSRGGRAPPVIRAAAVPLSGGMMLALTRVEPGVSEVVVDALLTT
jgi:hypothetical protein